MQLTGELDWSVGTSVVSIIPTGQYPDSQATDALSHGVLQ